jgi:hypothetical protein
MEDTGMNLCQQLKEKSKLFLNYSLALGDSNPFPHTAELLIFIRGIDDGFSFYEEFAPV